MEIVWTETAEEELEKVFEFEARKNRGYAIKVYTSAVNDVDRLRVFPEIGAREPLLEGEKKIYRRLVVARKYKVVYHFDRDAECVRVVSVWDCRQDPVSLKERVLKMYKR